MYALWALGGFDDFCLERVIEFNESYCNDDDDDDHILLAKLQTKMKPNL